MGEADANREQQPSAAEEVDWVEVYRGSRYAIPDGSRWRVFALDGEEPPFAELAESVTLITAWNPDSEEREPAWNARANAALAEALDEAQVRFAPAWGASLPGIEPAWKEDGFAVWGWSREEARDWGRQWGQRAVVYLDAESADLVFCEPGWAVVCGLRRFPDEARA